MLTLWYIIFVQLQYIYINIFHKIFRYINFHRFKVSNNKDLVNRVCWHLTRRIKVWLLLFMCKHTAHYSDQTYFCVHILHTVEGYLSSVMESCWCEILLHKNCYKSFIVSLEILHFSVERCQKGISKLRQEVAHPGSY